MTEIHTLIRPRVTYVDRDELKRALERDGATGGDLAIAMSVSRAHAYQWLRGHKVIGQARAVQMHEIYGVEVRLQPHKEPVADAAVDVEAA